MFYIVSVAELFGLSLRWPKIPDRFSLVGVPDSYALQQVVKHVSSSPQLNSSDISTTVVLIVVVLFTSSPTCSVLSFVKQFWQNTRPGNARKISRSKYPIVKHASCQHLESKSEND